MVGGVLTRRQKEVLDYVSRHIDRHGVAPTLQEIGRHLKLASVATVHKHLRRLEEKGAVRRLTHQSRALAVVPSPEVAAGARIPLLGTVAAGTPIEPIEVPGTITVPEELLGRGETFALRVRGDSAIDDGIHDGDVVIVEARRDARTAPRWWRWSGRRDGEALLSTARAHPPGAANAHMEPIVARPEDVEIRGVVVALLRRYR
jgi:repressor LexA